jgi:hypothetical protein
VLRHGLHAALDLTSADEAQQPAEHHHGAADDQRCRPQRQQSGAGVASYGRTDRTESAERPTTAVPSSAVMIGR